MKNSNNNMKMEEEFLIPHFDNLKFLSIDQPNKNDEVSSCKCEIFEHVKSYTEIPNNITDQDVVTFFYMLGCSLQRNNYFKLSAHAFSSGISVSNNKKSDNENLSSNGILLMKLYFELGYSQEQLKLNECMENYQFSLSLSMQHNDVTFEKQVTMRICNIFMERELHADAISGYLRVLVITENLLSVLNGDLQKFRKHWEIEKECEVRYNLCVAYNALHLYEDALKEAFNFKEIANSLQEIQNLTNLKNKKNAQIMQANYLIGQIYESFDDFEFALKYYKDWCSDIEAAFNNSETNNTNMKWELASAYQCLGKVYLKKKYFNEALDLFCKQSQIGKDINGTRLEVDGMLLQVEVLIEENKFKEARTICNAAFKLSQMYDDDYTLECLCMCKEASIFGREKRYDHAIYLCQRVIQLAKKSESETLKKHIQFQLATYTQHSTSEKELCTAFPILLDELKKQEQNYFVLKSEDVTTLHQEIESLNKTYSATQVVLCRLGEHELGLALAECNARREILLARNLFSHFPSVNFKGNSLDDNSEELNCLSVNKILSSVKDTCVLFYTLCDSGFLCYLLNPDTKDTKCYLLSDNVASPYKVMERLKWLISLLNKNKQSDAAIISNMYTTEDRSLPDFAQHKKRNISSLQLVIDNNNKENVLINEDATKLQYHNVLKEIYSILIQPFQTELNQLKLHSKVCVIPCSYLNKVPFDQLIFPANDKPFADRFNISVASCMLVLDNGPKTFEKRFWGSNIDSAPSRENELRKSYEKPKDLESLEFLGLDSKILGIVSSTSTGTNVITSPRYITPYRQVDTALRSYVIGSPKLSNSLKLNGNTWKPKRTILSVAQKECLKIAEYLDVTPIYGQQATKSKFLSCFSSASLLHICTYGCMKYGYLAFAPNNFPLDNPPFNMESCIVTLDDLLDIKIDVKLVVLSSGHGWKNEHHVLKLPEVLLTAGVQSVVLPMWSVPDFVSETFYFHFYLKLQNSCSISRAVYEAKLATKEKFPNPQMWNSFALLGRDNIIDISEIRRSQTQSYLSGTEEDVLQVSSLVELEQKPEEIFYKLQQCVARLSGNIDVTTGSDVVSFVIGLLEEGTDRLTCDENSDRPIVILPNSLLNTDGVVEMLGLLGFDFQQVDLKTLPTVVRNTFQPDKNCGDENNNSAQMVVFPHWNQDSLLLPTHQLLTGLHELSSNEKCLRCIANMLPLSQDDICHLIDLLSVTYHKPDWQLRKSDSTTKKIWDRRSMREFLKSIGFLNVRNYLVFKRTLNNRSLLVGSLQFFVAICLHRDHDVMENFNVSILGEPPIVQSESGTIESLNPVIMPRNEIFISSSWMQDETYKKEKEERKKLAEEISEKTDKYARALEHAKWWHRDIRIPQQTVHSFVSDVDLGDADRYPRKVKVHSGATPSCVREPVDPDPDEPRNLFETLHRREDARLVLNKRCVDVDQRHASSVRQSYVPYSVKISEK